MPIPPKMVSDTSRAKMISNAGMWGIAGREGGPQALAHVYDRVDQHRHLQPAQMIEICPGVINTAQKSDRNHHDREEQARSAAA